MKPETKSENDFVDLVLESPYTALAIKLVLFVGRGFPDRTILGEGKIFFIEFKDGDNGLSPQQKKWKRTLTRLGFKVYVCYSTQEAYKIFIKEMERS